jgi:uncharacterized protein
MKTSLYTVSVPLFIKALTNLSNFIDKAVIHAESKKFDVNVLIQSRLAPDQFPFIRQIQLASDQAKSFAPRLNNQPSVSLPDTEQTMEEAKVRIDKTIEILKAIKPEDVDDKEDADVTLPYIPGKKLSGFAYTTELAIPNFYFHITTAYAILRHNGVDLSKMDFVGGLSLSDHA